MNNKDQFKDLADKLINLGESREEFAFWLKIFDDLPDDKQRELIAMMLEELDEFKKIK